VSKYGRITAEFKAIPEEEPVFLLRGKDVLAPATIEMYANMLRAAAQGNFVAGARLRQQAEEVSNIAAAMIAWQSEHGSRLPD
jgi:hypothetical protein